MGKKKVLMLAPFKEKERKSLESELGIHYEFMWPENEDERAQCLKEANIIVGQAAMEEVQSAPKLEWVQMTWAGTDMYTRTVGFPRNVQLTNASGAFGDVMAEYAIGQIISSMKHFSFYRKEQEKCSWNYCPDQDETLFGKTVLILGAGDIGSKTAIRLKAFGCKTIGVRRRVDCPVKGFDQLITLQEITKYLPVADIVIGCIPNNKETAGLLDYEKLNLLQKNCTLLNMGRGNLIVTEDLCRMLEKGWFQAVILDVTDPEPLPEDHPLWKCERVVITPHISGPSFYKSEHTEMIIFDLVKENLSLYAGNEALRNVIIFEG